MKTIIAIFILIFSTNIYALEQQIPVSKDIYAKVEFESHRGKNPFETALAMNVQYLPVKAIRNALSQYLNYQLNYFTGWNKDGEAHVTVITPPEYDLILSKFVSIDRIERIALENKMQSSDMEIRGIGRGTAIINGKEEETYFIIIHSENLLNIRQQIYQEYVNNGGSKQAWDPNHYYPHITIGYSLRDLHESDNVIKDINSLDQRFELIWTDLAGR